MALSRGCLYQRRYRKSGKGGIWWVKFPGPDPKNPHRESTGCRDRRAAELEAERIMRRQELLDHGHDVIDPDADLEQLVAQWGQALLAPPKERTKLHVAETTRSVLSFLRESNVVVAEELTRERAEKWLRRRRVEDGISSRSYNKLLGYLRAWARWLQTKHVLPWQPFAGIEKLRPEPKIKRRALTKDEAARLLKVAPWRRRVLYRLVLTTGLRRGEAARLEWRDLGLKVGLLSLRAAATKARREEELPLTKAVKAELTRVLELRQEGVACEDPDVVARIRAMRAKGMAIEAISKQLRKEKVHRASGAHWWWAHVRLIADPVRHVVKPTDRVFVGGETQKDLENTLYVDLARAGIERETSAGRVDFHALRKTFSTRLREKKVHPITIQRLMRHSDSRLTEVTYQSFDVGELRSLVEGLA